MSENISLLEGKDLPDVFPGIRPNSYCVLQYDQFNDSITTNCQYETSNPYWDSHIMFETDNLRSQVSIIIKNKLPFGNSKNLSKVDLSLQEFPINNPINMWSDMKSTETGLISCQIHFQILISNSHGNHTTNNTNINNAINDNNSITETGYFIHHSISSSYTYFDDNDIIAISCSNGFYLVLQEDCSLAPIGKTLSDATQFTVGLCGAYSFFLQAIHGKCITVHSPEIILVDSPENSIRQLIQLIPITSTKFNLYSLFSKTYFNLSYRSLL